MMNMPDPNEATFKVVLERVKIGMSAMVSPEILDAMRVYWTQGSPDPLTRMLRVGMTAYIAQNTIHREVTGTIQVPASWWQHVKEALCPAWWLRRWPVQYRTYETVIQYNHLCPHLPIGPERSKTDVHLLWMLPPSHEAWKRCQEPMP